MKRLRPILIVVLLLAPASSFAAQRGILLLAHGGSDAWNTRVLELAHTVDTTTPTEVAFGMATRRTIQAALDRLASRGVTEIVAVPLFVSSWSSVITSTEYLLGLRAEAPADLAIFARMDHGAPGAGAADNAAHAGHGTGASELNSTPIDSAVRVTRITPAMNRHPLIAAILASRARSISTDPATEAVIIVAHGPSPEDDNRRWLADMRALAETMGRSESFASIDTITVRDDAPKAVKDAATAELRQIVTTRTADGRRVLIVPLLLSYGGIEKGIVARLDGLTYTMTGQALVPDDRLATWILEMAQQP